MKEMSAIKPASWNVEAQPFLKSILDGVAQPVWVVDHDGFIRFANPAALAALGYDDLSELEGKRPAVRGQARAATDSPSLSGRFTSTSTASGRSSSARASPSAALPPSPTTR
jgi:PAS domain-containing protein